MIGLNDYHFPMAEILAMSGILLMLQIILSAFMSRKLQKDSLVERIRYEE